MLNRYALQSYVLPTEKLFKKFFVGVNHKISVTPDDQGIADCFVEKLKNNRYEANIVTDIPLDSDVIILLDGLKHFNTPAEAIQCNVTLFNHILRIAKRFSQKPGM